MSKPRSRIRGPRFALTSPETCRACIKCVYGNGEHAAWCEKKDAYTSALPSTVEHDQRLDGVRALKRGARCEMLLMGQWISAMFVCLYEDRGLVEVVVPEAPAPFGRNARFNLTPDNIRSPQRAHAESLQPVETVQESANA